MPVYISMCRRNPESCNWLQNEPCTYPIIAAYAPSLGQLMFYAVHRYPADPTWIVETIGL